MKLKRRELLAGAAALGAARLAGAAAPELLVLSDYPQTLETPLEYFDRLITPTDAFFVRSHFGPPRLDPRRPLKIGGLVEKPYELTAAQLERLPQVTLTAVLQCAGNGRAFISPTVPGAQWRHGAMGQATWTGVRVRDLLARAKPKVKTGHLLTAGADLSPKPQVPLFHRSLPLERALHPDTLVATRMNGQPLPLSHGAPMRLVVPGWAGDHWLKWLTSLTVSETEGDGFWVQKGYRIPPTPVAPGAKVTPEQMKPVEVMPVKAVIARADGAVISPGAQEVVGVAFSGVAALSKVEVSVDGGRSWKAAALEGEPGVGRWQVFRLRFEAKPGAVSVIARASDASGAVQPEAGVWNPSGYFFNAQHRVTWTVAS